MRANVGRNKEGGKKVRRGNALKESEKKKKEELRGL